MDNGNGAERKTMNIDPSLIRKALDRYDIENVAVSDDGKIAPTMIEKMSVDDIMKGKLDDITCIVDMGKFSSLVSKLFGKVLEDFVMDTMVLPSNAAKIRQVSMQLNEVLTSLRPYLESDGDEGRDIIDQIEEQMEDLDSIARNLGNDG